MYIFFFADTEASMILGMQTTWFAVALVFLVLSMAGLVAAAILCYSRHRVATPRHPHNAHNAQAHPPVSFPCEQSTTRPATNECARHNAYTHQITRFSFLLPIRFFCRSRLLRFAPHTYLLFNREIKKRDFFRYRIMPPVATLRVYLLQYFDVGNKIILSSVVLYFFTFISYSTHASYNIPSVCVTVHAFSSSATTVVTFRLSQPERILFIGRACGQTERIAVPKPRARKSV